MHSKSYIVVLMTYDNADEVIEKLFESLLNRYQIGLETSFYTWLCSFFVL